jgi:O-Antigen ligase/Virulence factor membrane-bound polymerase, C-terminal
MLKRLHRVAKVVAYFLACVMMFGAYTYPIKQAPWSTYISDLLFGAGALLFFIFSPFGASRRFWKGFNLTLLAVIGVSVFASCLGIFDYSHRADLVLSRVLYLLIALFIFGIGYSIGEGYIKFVSFYFFFLGALVAFVAALMWHGLVPHKSLFDGFIYFEREYNRARSSIGQSNNFGVLMVTFLWLGWSRLNSGVRGSQRLLIYICAIILMQGIVISESRVAVLGLFGCVVLSFWKVRLTRCQNFNKYHFAIPLAIWIFVSMIYRIFFDLGTRATSVEGFVSGDPQRFRMWSLALTGILERPWLGWGVGSIPAYAMDQSIYFGSFDNSILSSFHNIFLDITFEYGLVASLLVFLGWVYIYRKALSRVEVGQSLIAVALAPIFIHSLFEYPLNYGFILWLMVGLLGLSLAQFDVPSLSESKYYHGASRLLSIFLLSFILMIWNSYLYVENGYRLARNSRFDDAQSQVSGADYLTKKMFGGLLERLKWITTPVSPGAKPYDDVKFDSLLATTRYYPTFILMWKVVLVEANRGNFQESRNWSQRLCVMYGAENCRLAAGMWQSIESPGWPIIDWGQWMSDHNQRTTNPGS